MSDKHLDPSTASSEQAAKTQRTAPTKINPVGRRTFLVLVAICVASFIGHLALLPHMPEMIPTHWDSAGNVNGYTGRVAIIGLDALPLLLLAMLRYLPGMDPRGQAYMRMGSFYNGFVVLFTLFMVGMTWTSELTVFGILPENGSPIGTITTLVVGMGFILLGNYMPKIKRNYTFGCKTPWALYIPSQSRNQLGADVHLAVLGMHLKPAAPRTLREDRPTRLAHLDNRLARTAGDAERALGREGNAAVDRNRIGAVLLVRARGLVMRELDAFGIVKTRAPRRRKRVGLGGEHRLFLEIGHIHLAVHAGKLG